MATSSINNEINIDAQREAEKLIDAMEQSELWVENNSPKYIIGIDLSPYELINNIKGVNSMVRTKINIDTMSKVKNFVNIAAKMKGTVKLIGKDAEGAEVVVNARSLMGAIYSMEWNEVWCEHESDEYGKIREFAV